MELSELQQQLYAEIKKSYMLIVQLIGYNIRRYAEPYNEALQICALTYLASDMYPERTDLSTLRACIKCLQVYSLNAEQMIKVAQDVKQH